MFRLFRWLPSAFALLVVASAGLVSQPGYTQYRIPIGKPGARSLIVKAQILDVALELGEELAEATERARFERLSELAEAREVEHIASIDRGTTFDQKLRLALPDGELAITVLQERPRRELRVELVHQNERGDVVQRITEARRELTVRPTRAIRAEPLDDSNRWLLLEIRLP